ncbi:uncharacterized protein BYT42DRAFT_564450 [Radiomyces spectabilis]|uniref:uncharacterized protein n=1 Tax=Radiomyces spectabilis TaxID=64574 RepID=UPI00221F1472|nr:uncharacterized protein BYT42DRAFT_564450 [Radiomyces spectabilis]KAI8385028.1 hypothetical protein BYT42DRAFT_564450 [Radiomyces spectabilis]
MMGTMASPLFDPEIESMLCTFFMMIALVFALGIIFFAFLTVKVDGIVQWDWAVVWIPLWIIDVVMFFGALRQLFSSKDDDELDEEDDAGDDDDENKRAARKMTKRRMRVLRRTIYTVYLFLIILFQIFIVLKLQNRVQWSAAVVFIPYFVLEGLHFVLSLIEFAVACTVLAQIHQEHLIKHLCTLFFKQFWLLVLRVVLFILIALRVDQIITCSWAVVFIPLYLVGVKYAVQLFLSYRYFSRLPQPEIAQQGKTTVMLGFIAFVIVGALFYALVGLIARRLDGYWYISMSHVFVPVFIVLSLLVCCSGCCLPCILMMSSVGDIEDPEQLRELIDPNRRITQSGETVSSRTASTF